MQTIILEEPGRLHLTATAAPAEPGPGEALLRIRRVGICGTDIHAFHGRQPFFSYPRILGHELGAEIAALGPDVTGVAVGDRVAVEPYLNCGHCVACRRGRTNCCTSLRVIGVHSDGGMRELITMPADKLHPSATLTLDQLALVETLGIGAHAVQRAAPEPGEQVLVSGAGPIGLTVMQFAHLAGAHVVALDISEERLAFAAAQGIAHQTLMAGDDVAAQLVDLLGDLPTAVFDATGNRQSMERAFQLVANGGRLTFVGLLQGEISFNDPEFHRRELTLLASRNATSADFRRIIAQIEAGKINTTPWITHRAGAAELVERFPTWLQPGSGLLKGMLTLGGEG
jgi:2-desacetyl-2-hydroxyethyl bacteriochlorophyllide A dehydrogenase